MSIESRKQTVRRYVMEVWGGGNVALVGELTVPVYVYGAPGMEPVRGVKGITDLVATYRSAFPDLSNTIEGQVAEGETVVTWGKTRGTHKGAFGDLPASGKSVVVPWVIVSRFDGEKIAEDWEVYDSLGLMQQLGPVAATRAAT